jgi:hypothetical protein
MSATFSVTADRDRDLIRITMAGFFAPRDIVTFLAARRNAHAELRCGPNQHLTLNDVREMKIQPQQAVVAFQDMLADPTYRSRRLAFIVAPTLARGQLARALTGRADAALFEDPAEAEAWLLGSVEAETPARRAAGRR